MSNVPGVVNGPSFEFYFFYEDGTLFVKNANLTDTSYEAIKQAIKERFRSKENFAKTGCGAFIVNQDSLNVQFYSFTEKTGLNNFDIRETRFLINNNSQTIDLLSGYCYWCHKHFPLYDKKGMKRFNPALAYRFMPLDRKPDSSKMWFREKSWYKK